MHEAFLAFGGNLGDAAVTLLDALSRLRRAPGIVQVQPSSLYRTSPVDSSGPDYVNAVARVHTTLTADALLALCQQLECEFGRVRPVGVHNAPRTLDVDILTYDALECASATLCIPHPRMLERLFVLVPLEEIAPRWCAPDGTPIAELIARVAHGDPSQQIQKMVA